MSRAPIEVSGYRHVTVVTYVIVVTVELCQEFVFRLAYVLYATTGTGYQVDAISGLTIFHSFRAMSLLGSFTDKFSTSI